MVNFFFTHFLCFKIILVLWRIDSHSIYNDAYAMNLDIQLEINFDSLILLSFYSKNKDS